MATTFVERVAVEVSGEGEAVLMIHGLGGTGNVWTPVLPAVARHRVVRPDLPGAGRSSRVDGPLSIERMAESMCHVCRALGLERVHVSGHSLGAIVALHLAVAEPGLVRSLALFGPLLSPPDPARDALRTRAADARAGGPAGMQRIADATVAAATSAETKARRPVAATLVRELVMRQCPDGYARSCEALADARAADVSRIACPTLLVTGDEDAIAPAQSVRHIAARIPGSRVEVLPRCGHWTTIEKPDECAELLRRFYATRR